MRRKTITTVILALLLLASAIATDLFAQPRRHHRHGPMLEVLADELNLSDDQVSTLKEQRFTRQKSAIEMRSRVRIAKLELRELMHADNVNEGEVKAKVEEIGKLKTNLQLNRVQGRLTMKKVLTPEQIEKLQELRKERFQQRHERGGRGDGERGHRRFRNFQGNSFGPDFDSFDFDDEEVDLDTEI